MTEEAIARGTATTKPSEIFWCHKIKGKEEHLIDNVNCLRSRVVKVKLLGEQKRESPQERAKRSRLSTKDTT